MKRKLERAADFDRRARRREQAQDADAAATADGVELRAADAGEVAAALQERASSEEEDSSGDEARGSDVDDDDNADEARVVKGAPSDKDRAILAARRAETSRIENIVPYRNKQRVLVFCSRGITSRFRHLMEDFRAMLVHHRKDIKHDTKRNLREINEVCELKACNSCVFFEARKRKDLYLWFSKTPAGPSLKFHVLNIHTMDELRLSGNCLKGSRPLLSFAAEFDADPTLRLVREVFTQVFGTPRGHPKSKPFVDHVMSFSLLDGRIWFRHFQITDTTQDAAEVRRALKRGEETVKLVEIGPRFVLDLVKAFDGSFGGRTLAENPHYVTPNAVRSERNKDKAGRYAGRKAAEEERAERADANLIPRDPVRDVFRRS